MLDIKALLIAGFRVKQLKSFEDSAWNSTSSTSRAVAEIVVDAVDDDDDDEDDDDEDDDDDEADEDISNYHLTRLKKNEARAKKIHKKVGFPIQRVCKNVKLT